MKKVVLMVAALSAMGLARAAMLPVTGTNTVGYVSVAAPAGANSIITVPFEACLGAGGAGMLADLVATNGLTAHASDAASADQLVVLTTNGTSSVYYLLLAEVGPGLAGDLHGTDHAGRQQGDAHAACGDQFPGGARSRLLDQARGRSHLEHVCERPGLL